MKKNTNTNRFRRCPNCPHHSLYDQKCCCQRNSVMKKARPMTSRQKREPSTIDHSSAVNTTVPTIIAEFSALRTQNNQLKRELLNVSAFVKDENCSLTANTDSSLSQKLFLANKNLKQALLQIDNLSKANKELCERNYRLNQQTEGLKIQLREVEDYLDRYKKKCKKMVKEQDILASREEMENLISHNQELEDEVRGLRDEIRCMRFQNKNFNMIGALSPEWVAHTGIKTRNQDIPTKCQEELPREQMEVWKKSLSQTISLLRNEGSHINSVSLQRSKVVSLDILLERLLESYSESILTHYQLLIKELNRKLNNYEKKVNNLASKLENFLMVFSNRKLKQRLKPQGSVLGTDRTPMSGLTNRLF